METKKQYERPMITDNIKLEAIAGACASTGSPNCKQAGVCTVLIAS